MINHEAARRRDAAKLVRPPDPREHECLACGGRPPEGVMHFAVLGVEGCVPLELLFVVVDGKAVNVAARITP